MTRSSKRPGPRALASLFVLGLSLVAVRSAALAAYPPLDNKDVLPPDFRLEKVFTGTVRPSGIAIAPDGTVYYGERVTGNVRVLIGGVQQATPFVTLSVATGGSQGLIDVVLHPGYAANGYVYVFYTESGTRANKIRRYQASHSGTDLVGINGVDIYNLGQSPGGTRIGGAMAFGADGKLYVTTGDLEASANGQNNSSMAGKLLRMNDDGTVPSDNPIAGSRVYAKGFRDGGGLAVNTRVGTLYQTDVGTSGVKEECNAIPEGDGDGTPNNCGWDLYSGKGMPAGYVNPLTDHTTLVTPTAVIPYTGTTFPPAFQGDVFYAHQLDGTIQEVGVQGAKLSDYDGTTTSFYDPRNDGDGTVDAGCPKKWADVALSGDGYMYLTLDADSTAQNGLYRIIYSDATREVGQPGSTHPLLVTKVSDTSVRLTWEDMKYSAFVGTPYAPGQPTTKYVIYKGSLPIDTDADGDPDWSHSQLLQTNGTVVNDSTLRADLTNLSSSASEYFLVSVQDANRETVGVGSDGTLIPNSVGITDWCNNLAWGFDFDGTAKKCLPDSVDATPAHNPLLFWAADEDWDGTHGALRSLWDYRDGAAVHLDLSANDCTPCQNQATLEGPEEMKYRARGVRTVTVFLKNQSGAVPYPDEQSCHNAIVAWRTARNVHYPIVCDRDVDGDGHGDFAEQTGEIIGYPRNWYIDHNWVVWKRVNGFDTQVGTNLGAKAYPEWCE